jgi:hypothetical protein
VTPRGRRFKDGLGGSTDSQGLALSRAKPRSRARQRAAVGTLAALLHTYVNPYCSKRLSHDPDEPREDRTMVS